MPQTLQITPTRDGEESGLWQMEAIQCREAIINGLLKKADLDERLLVYINRQPRRHEIPQHYAGVNMGEQRRGNIVIMGAREKQMLNTLNLDGEFSKNIPRWW